MGLADRDYHQMPMNQMRGQMPGNMPPQPSRLAGCPVVKWLLISNIAVFFLDMFLGGKLLYWGHFSVGLGLEHYQLWRLLTFQFLHANGNHLLANMIGLFFFGHFVERWWGSQRFLVYYLATGVAGALLYMVLFYAGWFGTDPIPLGGEELLPASYIPLVGASAGIFGVLVCVALIAPQLRVLLFFFIPMSMRTFAIGALVFSTYMILTNGNNAGGEAGHLGGAILGFILMKNPRLLSFVAEGPWGGKKRRTIDAKIVREKKIRPRIHINMDDTEVDRILDKVNQEGVQSLTEAEKNVLRRTAGES
jgi:membrane associated rhomboid family serine protease